MADDNDTRQSDGLILPVGAALGGLYTGGLLASHASGKNLYKKLGAIYAEQDAANEAYNETKAILSKRGGPLRETVKAHEKAKAAFEAAKDKYYNVLGDRWNAEISALTDTTKIGQYHIARIEGALESLDKSPYRKADLNDVADVLQSELKAAKECIDSKAFKGMDAKAARQELEIIENKVISPFASNVRKAVKAHKNNCNPFIIDEFASVDSTVAEKIAKATTGSKATLDATLKILERKYNNFGTAQSQFLAKELEQIDKADLKEMVIGKMQRLNAEEGFLAFLKRPWDILKSGSTRAKIFTVVSGITLGAIAFGAARSMSVKPSDSHADRVQDSRNPYGAGQGIV